MQYTEQGLRLSKAELTALLAFASKDSNSNALFGVHIKVVGDKVKARASNGSIAIDAVGLADVKKEKDQEWFVHRGFLHGAHKVVESGQSLKLKFSGASLRDAAIEDGDGNELSMFSWSGKDAANAQTSFPDKAEWDKLLKVPNIKNGLKFVDVKVDCLSLLKKVGAAAGVASVALYEPPNDQRLLVKAEGEDTTWLAIVDPDPTEEDEE